MPRGDRTGPAGMGAMTGRGAGYCAGLGMSGYRSRMLGGRLETGFGGGRRGLVGRGFGGGGRGWRNDYYATGLPGWIRFGRFTNPYLKPDQKMERQALKNEAETLESELSSIRKRLEEIESGTAGR